MRAMRLFCALLILGTASAPAATLEQMSLDEIIEKSTYIVRGRAGEARTIQAGGLLFTLCEFDVLEQWKGEPRGRLEVALPGGKLGSVSQRFGGVPSLAQGAELVVFLWEGPSGRSQIVGLSQGLFEVNRRPGGEAWVVRKPNADLVLEPETGNIVQSAAIEMPLAELAGRIKLTLGGRRQPVP